MDIQSDELHDRIERVEAAEASENDLVTVAVPPDKPLGEALERVEEDRAEAEGGDCLVVPTDFDRGRQFSEAFGGVAAILRFPIE